MGDWGLRGEWAVGEWGAGERVKIFWALGFKLWFRVFNNG